MRLLCEAAIGLLVLALAGCATGMEPVNEPKALLAPNARAVIVVLQPAGSYVSAPVMDERGSCLGYTQSDAWFTARVGAGEQVIHVKDPENLLSVKLDLSAGRTYFLRAARDRSGLTLIPVRPSDPEWAKLDRELGDGQQYKVDRQKCDATLSDMVWMPGQDLPKILEIGRRKAEAAGLLVRPKDGVVWKGSAAKSAR